MFKITHDKMRWLEFEYRFVEIESQTENNLI